MSWTNAFRGLGNEAPKSIGKLLRDMRLQAEYTQGELANRIGISRETVSAIENDKLETISALDMEVVRKWKSACGSSVAINTSQTFTKVIKKFFQIS